MKIYTFLFAFLFCGLFVQAQVEPSIQWKVLKLPHFDLVYDAKHQELAELYAHRLEDNIRVLSLYFLEFPDRITVVLNDSTDLTNGYATPIPYDHIVIFPVLPGPMEAIGEYGDWARELTMHEYTHILSFEPRRGVVRILRSILGSIITPNLLLPRWWLEGVAVEMETRTSLHGRLRSVFQDATLRAYSLGDRLDKLSLAEINEVSIHTWPYGARPYLFGSLMWSEMFAMKGKEIVQNLHWRYGGRMPFFLNGPVKDNTGLNYTQILQQMKRTVSSKARDQIAVLKQAKVTNSIPIKLDGLENFSPSISPNGLSMAYLSKSETAKRSIKILHRPNTKVHFEYSQKVDGIENRFTEGDSLSSPIPKQSEDGPPGGTIQRISWLPDSQKFVYDKLDHINRFKEFSDLYMYDLQSRKNERLTTAARAREPAVSPSGKAVAFVELEPGRTHLSLLNLESKEITRVYSTELQARISFPVFLSENQVLFSERKAGREFAVRLDLNTRKTSQVLPNFKEIKFAFLSEKGLFFTASNNGVNNIYLANKDLTLASAVTHTLTSVLTADYDPYGKDLYFTELSDNGLKISLVNQDNWFAKNRSLPKIAPLLAERYQEKVKKIEETPIPASEDYSPWNYLIPRYWFPNLFVTKEGTSFSFQTSAFDPLMKHAYSFVGLWDGVAHRGSYSFLYTNNQNTPEISAKMRDFDTNLLVTGTQYRDQFYNLQSVWQLTPVSKDLSAGAGWMWRSRSFGGFATHHQGPSVLANYSDYSMSGAQISPESGQGASLDYTQYLKNGEWQGFDLWNYSFVKYFSTWLPKRHALMAKLQGQYIDGIATFADLDTTFQYPVFANTTLPQYVMRGFRSGQFVGKTLNNVSLEYRFPLNYIYRGAGTTPFFLRRLHGAVVADGIQLDGFVYNESLVYQRIDRSETLWSGGFELKADLTLGYHIPITALFGFYASAPNRYAKESHFVIGFQAN